MIDLVYVASPYSAPDAKRMGVRRMHITQITAELMGKYNLSFYSPIIHSAEVAKWGSFPGTWEFWKNQDLPMLNKCDQLWIVMLEGWKESVGVQAEIEFWNKKARKPIVYVDPITLKRTTKKGG